MSSPFAVNNIPTTYVNNGKRRAEDLDFGFFDFEAPSKRARTDASSSSNPAVWDLFEPNQPTQADWMNWNHFTDLFSPPSSSSSSSLTLSDASLNTPDFRFTHQHTADSYPLIYNAEPSGTYLNTATQSGSGIFEPPQVYQAQQPSDADWLSFESHLDAFLANFSPDASGNLSPLVTPSSADSLLLAREPVGVSFQNDAPCAEMATKFVQPVVNANIHITGQGCTETGAGPNIQPTLQFVSEDRDKIVDLELVKAFKAEYAEHPEAAAYLEEVVSRFSELYKDFRKVEVHRPYNCKWRVQQGTSTVRCGAQISHSALSKHVAEHLAAEGHVAKNGGTLGSIPRGKFQCKWGGCTKSLAGNLERHITTTHEDLGRKIGSVEVEGQRSMELWGYLRRDQSARRLVNSLRGVLKNYVL